MKGRPLLPVQRLGHKHVAADGVDVVDAAGRLVGAGSRDAVADPHVLVLVGADLERVRRERGGGEMVGATEQQGSMWARVWAKSMS